MTTTIRQPTLLRSATVDLPPAYFALVMATGIISIGAHMLGLALVAHLLFYINGVAYVVLWLLHGLRLLWFPRRLPADMFDYDHGPGYFTWVASTAVLGSQFVVLEHAYHAALVLWILAGVLWLGLTYAIFTGFTVRRDKPPLHKAINGGWLLAVVATQAVAVLSAYIAAEWPQPFQLELNFLALSLWLWGGMLYIWLITLVFYRYTFFDFTPGELTPPFWISMGAMAISTLAGSLLITNSAQATYLASLLPFIKGITILYWVTVVVDTPVIAARCLAARSQAFPVGIRPAVLGRGIPVRHVYGRHCAYGTGDGFGISTDYSRGLFVCLTVGLGGDVRRIAAQHVAAGPAVSAPRLK